MRSLNWITWEDIGLLTTPTASRASLINTLNTTIQLPTNRR